jgi:hypothetical protein
VERARLNQLIEKLLRDNLTQREYEELTGYLAGMIGRVAETIAYELKRKGKADEMPINILRSIERFLPQGERALSYAVGETILHILKRKSRFLELLNEGGNLKAYLGVVVKNLLLDIYRSMSRNALLISEEDMDTDERRETYPLNRDAYKKELLAYEIAEIEDLITKTLEPEELKYLCYKKDSKRYKCLWLGKSDDAIYQDVRRKGDKVLEKLREALIGEGIDREVLEEFSRVRLSEMCEELRLKKCKGEIE